MGDVDSIEGDPLAMSARVLYDHELEELVNQAGFEASSLIGRLAQEYPEASIEQILYTVSEHIRVKGLSSEHPNVLLAIPVYEEPLDDAELPSEMDTEMEPSLDTHAYSEVEDNDKLAPAIHSAANDEIQEEIRRRRAQRQARRASRSSAQQVSRDVSVRDLLADVESLEL